MGAIENEELFYTLALSKISGIGPVRFKKIIELTGSAAALFSLNAKQLRQLPGLSNTTREAIAAFRDFDRIQQEIDYTRKHDIQILLPGNPLFPERLRHCADTPIVLFYKGQADLNHARIISVIGTRSFTEYGRQLCESLIESLKAYNVFVCSGLAFGIDAIAHKACVKSGIPTIGVVAHGLDTIYPAAHRGLAREMIQQGGLLTEFFSGTIADKGNFPARNRIVAGMCDATIVIETDIKGGSMITADLADSYNRDVFCFPGRVGDTRSSGCLHLIKHLKAQLITSAEDVIQHLGWENSKKKEPVQRSLFLDLSRDEQQLIEHLQTHERLHIDELALMCAGQPSQMAGTLLQLEMQQLIRVLPGKMIELIR
jgi:DNA processing protein